MSTVSESLSILAKVDITLAWKSQAAISLLIHRIRALDAPSSPQLWFSISPIDVTEAVLVDCLRSLYIASDQELMPFRAAVEDWIIRRFRVLPYVRWLPNGDLPCHTFLIEVAKDVEYSLYFYSYVWTQTVAQSRGHEIEALLLGSANLSPEDCFLLVLVCRRHALRYVELFPDAPLISDSRDRRNTHVKVYVESCGVVQKSNHINTVLNIGRKLLAMEKALDCPGISLAMFRHIRFLETMLAQDIQQMIQLLGLFGQFPRVTEAGHGLSLNLQVYQKRYNLKQ